MKVFFKDCTKIADTRKSTKFADFGNRIFPAFQQFQSVI